MQISQNNNNPIDKKDKLEIRIIGETQNVEYYKHIWDEVNSVYNISHLYTSINKLTESDYPFRIASVIGLTNYGSGDNDLIPLKLRNPNLKSETPSNNFFQDVAIDIVKYSKTILKPVLTKANPSELFWENVNNINNIPMGSIWYQPKNKYRPEGLYYKNTKNEINRCVNVINNEGITVADGAAAFHSDYTTSPVYIIQKSLNVDTFTMSRKSGSTPVTLSGTDIETTEGKFEDRYINHYFKNTLTLREGNLSVCGITNSVKKVRYSEDINNIGNPYVPYDWTDASGSFGQIWSERQFLIGPEKANKNWAVIDSYMDLNAPALLSTNLGDHIINPFNPIATNSIILGNWKHPEQFAEISLSKEEAIDIVKSLGLRLGTDAFPFDSHPNSTTKGLFAYRLEDQDYGGAAFWNDIGVNDTGYENTSITNEYRPFLKTTNNYIDDDKILKSIGDIYDSKHAIIIGDISSCKINSPHSFICNLGTTSQDTEIISEPGLNIHLGSNNSSYYSPFTLMIGSKNNINNKNNEWSGGKEMLNDIELHKKAIDRGGGNVILGKNNNLKNTIHWIDLIDGTNINTNYFKGLKLFNSNIVLGKDNNVYLTEYSLINGEGNCSVGKSNIIFGKNNTIGKKIDSDITIDLSGSECHHNFIFGVSNKLTITELKDWDADSNIAPQNIVIMGKNNNIDLSYNLDVDRSYIVFGSDISNNLTDLSKVRFFFGTKEKKNYR